jgi:hypothetical protein
MHFPVGHGSEQQSAGCPPRFGPRLPAEVIAGTRDKYFATLKNLLGA